MADGRYSRSENETLVNPSAAVSAGECWQLSTGEAAVYTGDDAVSSGDRITFETRGKFWMTKASGFVALAGGRAYWDHSANAISYRKVNDRDFYVGRFVEDAASGDVTCLVDLNIDPRYDIELARDPYLSTLVGTAAAGGLSYPVALGGALILELTATNEAQKVDALSVDGFAKGANAIIEGAFRVISDGAGTAVDVSLGVASGTHATDFDSVAESVLIHLDANDVDINAESDDGTTEVAATDTTIDYTEGSAVAQRVEFWMDMRDPADVQIYVNGSLVLGSTTFNVNAATGPFFLVAHVEKTSSTDTYKLAVDWLRARLMEQ